MSYHPFLGSEPKGREDGFGETNPLGPAHFPEDHRPRKREGRDGPLPVTGIPVRADKRYRVLPLDRRHVLRGRALGRILHGELYFLSFLQGAKTLHSDFRLVAENILAAVLWSDKAKTLRIVEPFNLSDHFFPCSCQRQRHAMEHGL